MSGPSVAIEFGAKAPRPPWLDVDSPAPASAGTWCELTARPVMGTLIRLRARDLGEARRRYEGIRRSDPRAVVLLDLYAYTADTWERAHAEYERINPYWQPGRVLDTVTYVGTHKGLTSLISDISAAGVADGATVQGPDSWLRYVQHDVLAPWLAGAAKADTALAVSR
ncbi:hypothetical protein [Hoyosella subflava]|uniref:Uncharacterized protein n=1 Tax=Hoyosella subflava (strain DSM 45089 / JCM 17490 / NBRC 109087 / DQS3-9A1) TaxID=443218 RepID=F6EHI3_HOYSD|nr:hypothetical protein [Hoyosella subflava]AEF42347.1 hypothetical protein AS9A_3911 [Hoyosella subflava DQS3-9A1]